MTANDGLGRPRDERAMHQVVLGAPARPHDGQLDRLVRHQGLPAAALDSDRAQP